MNIISLQEYIPLGQRIDSFSIEVMVKGKWDQIYAGSSIGAKRLIKINKPITTNKVRVNFKAPVCITISEFGIYKQH